MLLLILACTPTNDIKTGDFTDADADGFAAAVDCNDNDASVYPGAEEVWYDGVDQDCDENDTDQDGDGVEQGTDCDDTDPSVYPGAGEVPQDGIDQNCDGSDATAVVDADMDGFTTALDCDDTNAAVHPGATETAGNGVDENCDGSDAAVSAEDADGDGYDNTVDCNDSISTVHPGATEVASDGIDQDCDGVDTVSVARLSAGKLIITEILNKPGVVQDAYGEWFEIYNNSGGPVDLQGMVVTLASGLSFTVPSSVPVAKSAYAIFGREGDTTINGNVKLNYDYRSDFALDNDIDTLSIGYGNTVIDSVAWDDTNYFPDTTGASMSLDSAHLSNVSNDTGQYWCDGTKSFGGGDLGTPGAANSACTGMTDSDGDGWVSAWDCNDSSKSIYPGAKETAKDGTDSDCDGADGHASDLSTTDLVISEIMNNPDIVADADGEWFEIYNSSSYSYNLSGMGVGDGTGVLFTVDQDLVISSKGYVVLAISADSLKNGGVTNVGYDYPGSLLSLPNSTGTITLYSDLSGSKTLDSVSWDNGVTFPDTAGSSMQLRKASLSTTSNNSGGNWCNGSTHIANDAANDVGTPGAANDGC